MTVESAVCKVKADVSALGDRVASYHDQMTRFETRLDENNQRMSAMQVALNSNSATLTTNSADTAEILGILRDSKSFFRVAGAAGSVLKWTLGVATALLIFWYAIKDWPNRG